MNLYQFPTQLWANSPDSIIKMHLNNFFLQDVVALDNVIGDKRIFTNRNDSKQITFRRLYLNLCATFDQTVVDGAIRDLKLKTKCDKLMKRVS